jgi:transcriptional regulator GlxA family with amidase domain
MLEAYQLLDVAGPIEIMHTAGRKYLSNIPPVPPQAPNIAVHWTGPSLNANVNATSNARTFLTATFDCYPKLNVLFIPGVPPSYVAPPEIVDLMNRAVKESRIVMSDCTSHLILALLGLLDGKNTTLNNGLGLLAKQLYPKVNVQLAGGCPVGYRRQDLDRSGSSVKHKHGGCIPRERQVWRFG